MTWEQQFAAMKAIAPSASLLMREPGDWYVSLPGLEMKDGGMLGSVGQSGATPEKAVTNTWLEITAKYSVKRLVRDAYKPTRVFIRWNGFMWDVQPDPEGVKAAEAFR